jgi:hypothetical protein
MSEKKIEVCIGTDRTKAIRVRLSLMTVDSGAVMSEHFHSIDIQPGDDPTARRAAVEAHIANPKGEVPGAPWPAIPDAEWQMVEGCVTGIHTTEVVAAYRKQLKASQQAARINATSNG